MASRKDRNKAKRSARHKKRREAARSKRRNANEGTSSKHAPSWPTGDCWIGAEWYERGADVPALFVRSHSNGVHSAVRLRVDLAQEGLTEVEVRHDLTTGALQGWIGQLSEDDAMVSARPQLVVKLAHTGHQLAVEAGDRVPRDWDSALSLFGDIGPTDAADEFLTGLPDTEERPKETWIDRAARWLFGSP